MIQLLRVGYLVFVIGAELIGSAMLWMLLFKLINSKHGKEVKK
jgi:hypothetical protein